MATEADMVTALKQRAFINPGQTPFTDNSDALLKTFISDSVRQHNSSLSLGTLPVAEEELVLILAQIKVIEIHLSKAAYDPDLSGASGYGQDRNSPFNKWMQLKKDLIARYKGIAAALGLTVTAFSAPSVVSVSSLVIEDERDDVMVPVSAATVPSIYLEEDTANRGADFFILKFAMKDYPNFVKARVAAYGDDTDPGAILQEWNFDTDSGIPYINNSATILTNARWFRDVRSFKIENVVMTPPKVYRYVVIIEGYDAQWGYSNELVITLV